MSHNIPFGHFYIGIIRPPSGNNIAILAKWLHVSVPEKIKRGFPIDIELKDASKSELVELENSHTIRKQVVERELRASSMIVLIHRNGKYLPASGDTTLEQSNHLFDG